MDKSFDASRKTQEDFFERLAQPQNLLDLFDCLPGVYLFIKDREGRYVQANQVMCDVVGLTDSIQIVGKTDFDFFPPAVAAQYTEEDQRVIETGMPLIEKRWPVPGANGLPLWYVCNKLPLLNRQNEVIGIAGVKRPHEPLGDGSSKYSRLLKVVEFVTANFGNAIDVGDLAKHADLSVSQLQREFSRVFGITPNHYIREVRVGVARHFLKTSDADMAHIATHCGFYDQSHFSRLFKKNTGLSPMQYRKKYMRG